MPCRQAYDRPVCRVTATQRPLRHAPAITRTERADEAARHDTSRDRANEYALHHAFDRGALMVVWTSDIWPSFTSPRAETVHRRTRRSSSTARGH